MSTVFMTGQQAQVASGEYVGNGQNTLTLSFPFVPKYVVITSQSRTPAISGVMNAGSVWGISFVWGLLHFNEPTIGGVGSISYSGSAVTFTSTNPATLTMNINNAKYLWTAIG